MTQTRITIEVKTPTGWIRVASRTPPDLKAAQEAIARAQEAIARWTLWLGGEYRIVYPVAVTTEEMAEGTVTAAKIAAQTVTAEQMAEVVAKKVAVNEAAGETS